MEKEFVPYQPSLDMKELGFDEPCFGYYGKNNVFMFFVDVTSCITNSEFGLYPTAPTFSQAFRWFREKHGITSEVSIESNHRNDTDKWMFTLTRTFTNTYSHSPITYKTYEEAELACLKKLIQLVKEK